MTTALWLDGADPATLSLTGTSVNQWNDKSGNANNASQGSAGAKPTLITAGLNSKDVLSFDGNDFLSLVNQPTNSRIVSVYAVAASSSVASDQYIIDSSGTASYGGGLSLRFTTSSKFRFWGQDVLNITDTTTTNVNNVFSIVSGIEDASVRTISDNGSQEGSSIPGTSARSTGSPEIGHSGLLGGYLTGKIAEIIVVDAATSFGTKQTIEGYLAWKWGLQSNLPVGHTYKNAAPTA